MSQLIAAIDQGTTSTRCILFDTDANPVASGQREHRQLFPRPGWVEHDPLEIWQATQAIVAQALDRAKASPDRVVAVGIANQRETVVIWNRHTGQPYRHAIVWQDTRTKALCEALAGEQGASRFAATTGLPLATYFSGPKIRWALDEDPALRNDADRGDALAGTIDSYLIWQLTGGPRGGRHVTDVTNASRTLLMDLRTLNWDESILDAMRIPRAMLPSIVPSIDRQAYGVTQGDGPLGAGIPIGGALGDQQAALLGQGCFNPGDTKNTYGTGCFLLLNTGAQIVNSTCGLLTTVAYQQADSQPHYALEGSIAVTGALIQWLRDNLGIIETSADVEALARSVPDTAGMYIVPAFSGLFAPHWRSDARGVFVGLTRMVTKAHIARAALEATCYQTREAIDAMRQDTGTSPNELKVDGGMTVNDLLMQTQADVLGLPVVRPRVLETTALGAAYAAGLALGVWPDMDSLRKNWQADRTWQPMSSKAQRDEGFEGWRKAVERTLNWAT